MKSIEKQGLLLRKRQNENVLINTKENQKKYGLF
jgi:hypothetical protein